MRVIEILSEPVDRFRIGNIQSLIALKVPESEQIEFKETLSTKKRNADPWVSGEGRVGNYARHAALDEVTAFANAFGGPPRTSGRRGRFRHAWQLSDRALG